MYTGYGLDVAIITLVALLSAGHGASNVKDGLPSMLRNVQNEPNNLDTCETSQNYRNIAAFDFNPRNVLPSDTACLSFRMLKDMGLVQQLHIPAKKLSRFIQKAKRGYRSVPYHNWEHGFSVFHFSYAVLKNCEVTNSFKPLERLALLIAAMCHDLDHPGTNSRYQEETNSSLAQEYQADGSILERHHIEKTLNLLENPKNNFVAQLPEDESFQFKKLIREIILATDLTTHFKTLPEEQTMAREGFNPANNHDHTLLRSVIISSADLSDLSKDWSVTRKSAKLVNTEFFDQGDKEKDLGIVPAKIMDRFKVNIAEEQVKFISEVVLPLFRVLASLCPQSQVCINSLENNIKYWQRAIPYFEKQRKNGHDQLQFVNSTELNHIPEMVRTGSHS